MRYILGDGGYIDSVSCNQFECKDKSCMEYTGTIPDGYDSLADWAENANIRAYYILEGNLVYSAAKDAELQAEWALTGDYKEYSTEEKIIGQWIDGKPIYRKTIVGTSKLPAGYSTIDHNVSNIGTRRVIKDVEFQANGNSWGNTYGSATAFVSSDSITATTVGFDVGSSWANMFIPIVTIEYTKTTD